MGRASAAVAAVLGGIVLLGILGPAGAARADDDVPITVTVPTGAPEQGDGSITNAELRWGLSREASSGAYAGGCNFLSAGIAGDAGSSRVWTEADGLYSAQSGEVTIEKATASGGWQTADFSNKCVSPDGSAVTVSSLTSSTQSQVVIDGGTGSVSAAGGLQLAWRGSFTVAFYGGMTYWSATDPTLALDASGTGRLTATLSGYGASRDDPGTWLPVGAQTVVLAEFRNVSLANAGGFGSIPEYLGVANPSGGQAPQSAENAAFWGAFPPEFLSFQELTGQSGYWQTTGGARDAAKPATLLLVNYDADAPALVPTVDGAAPGGAAPTNTLNTRPPAAAAPAAGTAAGASGAAAAGAAVLPIIAMRDSGGLVPEVTAEGASPLLLPLLGTALALLVSVLAALHLSGRLPLPRRRAAR
ncbi:hypothetical protein B7R21_05045 [Subtercola boreus]|uniref:Htaa domain-containing protein n=1 Tax=Subtercola boreus TaxID=120213 RepID=A0A3E0VZ62_9MICO|nr:hypothetical protein B7R21_05045 [Subtercola boreus]